MKNLGIFEPQIERHYAYKKTCTGGRFFLDIELYSKDAPGGQNQPPILGDRK